MIFLKFIRVLSIVVKVVSLCSLKVGEVNPQPKSRGDNQEQSN